VNGSGNDDSFWSVIVLFSYSRCADQLMAVLIMFVSSLLCESYGITATSILVVHERNKVKED